jgi:hypothetical protein
VTPIVANLDSRRLQCGISFQTGMLPSRNDRKGIKSQGYSG